MALLHGAATLNPALYDMLGTRVEVGDHIAYPTRKGSYIYQNILQVEQFWMEDGVQKIRGITLNGSRVVLGARGAVIVRRIVLVRGKGRV